MKATLNILEEARDLIADFEGWVQGNYAWDDTGLECDPGSDRAVAWCAAGAVIKAGGGSMGYATQSDETQRAYRLLECAARERYHVINVAALNDGEAAEDEAEAHGQVLRAFDDAILAHKIALGVS